ncbi:MAG: methylmalonyl Co-A mutase-associated GTPase MeaB [Alphaproteobacteria bacterium]|nr:MAG: methylmalonyl Co-A mutase-associated GTPase MeaB [Alphaproteobacteria bacterium]
MTPPIADLVGPLRAGQRRALARAITLAESTLPQHRALAEAVLTACPPVTTSLRIGLSGVPGVGKSSFIERFGMMLVEAGHRVSVLAVDPSSPVTGGSILGDKTRMATLSTHPHAFVRPTAAGATLGGVARRTADTIQLVEAAGYDVVLVETVGVGQSETAVHGLVDLFCVLLPPAGGDELQGIKKGIIELADLLVVTKADGDTAAAAGRAVADYRAALHLLRPGANGWVAPVLPVSALTGAGIAEVWAAMRDFAERMRATGAFATRRSRQTTSRLWQEVTDTVLDSIRTAPEVAASLTHVEAQVRDGTLHPAAAARGLLALWRGVADAP